MDGRSVISFNTKTSTDEQKKHDDFVDRMMEKGYTIKKSRNTGFRTLSFFYPVCTAGISFTGLS